MYISKFIYDYTLAYTNTRAYTYIKYIYMHIRMCECTYARIVRYSVFIVKYYTALLIIHNNYTDALGKKFDE